MLLGNHSPWGSLRPAPPKSNAERQREFRERNPGYYGRLHRKRKAEMLALLAQRASAEVVVAKREPLMLPAPVETIEIPGMTTIQAIPTREAIARLKGE